MIYGPIPTRSVSEDSVPWVETHGLPAGVATRRATIGGHRVPWVETHGYRHGVATRRTATRIFHAGVATNDETGGFLKVRDNESAFSKLLGDA
jgi:hypothetical protein